MLFYGLLLIFIYDSLSLAALDHFEEMSANSDSVHSAKGPICGGVGDFRPVNEEDLKIWDMYKEHLEKKIQKQFNVLKTYALKPVQVATQIVAGTNYFFKVELPDKKYATARVYHVPWQKATHGQEDHVAVHEKLADSPGGKIEHF